MEENVTTLISRRSRNWRQPIPMQGIRDHGGSYRPVRTALFLGGGIGHCGALYIVPLNSNHSSERDESARGRFFLRSHDIPCTGFVLPVQ